MLNNIFKDINNICSEINKCNEECSGLDYEVLYYIALIEDKRFCVGVGFDIVSYVRLAMKYILYGEVKGGGSTIEQQLVRTITGKRERTYSRKIREVLYAFIVFLSYRKLQIIHAYGKLAFTGTGLHGCDAASRKIYGRNTKEINRRQKMVIAATLLFPVPSTMSESWKKKVKNRAIYIRYLCIMQRRAFNCGFFRVGLYKGGIHISCLNCFF